jgi:hypothetical protein
MYTTEVNINNSRTRALNYTMNNQQSIIKKKNQKNEFQ